MTRDKVWNGKLELKQGMSTMQVASGDGGRSTSGKGEREGGGGGSWPNTKKDILARAQERELKAGL